LEARPLHPDEGVNGYFVLRLFREGWYQYDPANYHGPALYYLALVTVTLNSFFFGRHGLSTFAIRLVPALCGLGVVWLILSLRRRLGPAGSLAGAALAALSPAAVYFSRDFIHESPFVFFTLALAAAALRYRETGRPVYLMLASAAAALLFATKETAVISAAALFAAMLAALAGKRPHFFSPGRFGGLRAALAAALLFLSLLVLFYSSFLNSAEGLRGAVQAFPYWAKTARTAHRYPWYQYLAWLARGDLPLLALGAAGLALAARRPLCARFAVFTGAWACCLLAAYSLTPYKTPWLALNFLVPLALLGGWAVERIYREGLRQAALAITAAALAVSTWQTIGLNFFHYDEDRYPYVYSQTQRGFLALAAEVNAIAARAGTGTQTPVAVTAPEYWPLPWYLRDYAHVAYYGAPGALDEAIVIGAAEQEPELRRLLGDRYQRIGSYPLRPGLKLVLFVQLK
jgi:uncharacterized protein (TIGR03663 family)